MTMTTRVLAAFTIGAVTGAAGLMWWLVATGCPEPTIYSSTDADGGAA